MKYILLSILIFISSFAGFAQKNIAIKDKKELQDKELEQVNDSGRVASRERGESEKFYEPVEVKLVDAPGTARVYRTPGALRAAIGRALGALGFV